MFLFVLASRFDMFNLRVNSFAQFPDKGDEVKYLSTHLEFNLG